MSEIDAGKSEEIREVVREKYGDAARMVLERRGRCGSAETTHSCCGGPAKDAITSDLCSAQEASVVHEAALLASIGCTKPCAARGRRGKSTGRPTRPRCYMHRHGALARQWWRHAADGRYALASPLQRAKLARVSFLAANQRARLCMDDRASPGAASFVAQKTLLLFTELAVGQSALLMQASERIKRGHRIFAWLTSGERGTPNSVGTEHCPADHPNNPAAPTQSVRHHVQPGPCDEHQANYVQDPAQLAHVGAS